MRKVTINNVEGLKNKVAHDRQGVRIQAIALKSNKSRKWVELYPLTVLENDLFRNGDVKVEESLPLFTRVGKTRSCEVARKTDKYPGSRTLLVVDMAKDMSLKNSVTGGLYVRWSEEGNLFAVKTKEGFRSLISGKIVTPYTFFKNEKELRDDADHYCFFNSSTSMKRKTQCFLIRCNDFNVSAAEEVLCRLTHGASRVNAGKMNDRAGNIKLSDRMGLSLTANKDLGAIDCYAVYDGEWAHEGVSFFDGSSLVSSAYAADIYGKALGQNLSEKSAMGLWPQHRMIGTGKAFGAVIPEHAIEQVIARMQKNGVSVVRFVKVTQEINESIGRGDYAGQLIIIGEGTPSVVLDRNNLKTYVDFTREARMKVLDIAKTTQARTNIQTVQCLSTISGFKEVLVAKGKATVDRYLNGITEQTMRPIEIDSAKNCFLPNVLPVVANDYARREKAIWKAVVTNTVKGIERAVSRVNFDVDGVFARGTGDFGCFFGLRVLGNNQVFIRGIEPGATVQITRTPKAAITEQMMAEVIGMKEVRTIVGSSDLTREERSAIIAFYAAVPNGVLVVPGTNEFKNKTGGSDLDFDAFNVVADKEWVGLANQVEDGAVDIKFTKVHGMPKENSFSLKTMRKGWIESVSSDNEDIGVICNRNSLVLALITSDQNVSIRVCKDAFEPTAKNSYARHFAGYTSIGQEENDFLTSVSKTLNVEDDTSRTNFLLDANAAFCSDEGRSIDSSKTGEIIPPLLPELDKIATAEILKGIKFNIKNGKVVVGYPVAEEGKTLVACASSKARAIVAEYASEKLSAIIEPLAFEEEHKAQLEQGSMVKSLPALTCIKGMYTDVVGIYNTNADEDSDEGQITSAQYKNALGYLANMARIMTKEETVTDRWLAAKFCSMRNKSGLREDGGNGFYTILKEETVLSVSSLFGVNNTVGAEIKLTRKVEEGAELVFQDGQADSAIAVSANLNGKYTISKVGNKHFATASLDSVVSVPEIDGRFAVALHASERRNIAEVGKRILAAGKVVVKANRADGDYLCDMDGNKIARISVQDNGVLSKFYNNLTAEVNSFVTGEVKAVRNSDMLIKVGLILLSGTEYSDVKVKTIEKDVAKAAAKESAKRIAEEISARYGSWAAQGQDTSF